MGTETWNLVVFPTLIAAGSYGVALAVTLIAFGCGAFRR